MAIKKKESIPVDKISAKGFVNWSIDTKAGKLNSSKGFPIFDNPEYPNPEEALLLKAAEANGGILELNMKVRVCLNKTAESKEISAEDLLQL